LKQTGNSDQIKSVPIHINPRIFFENKRVVAVVAIWPASNKIMRKTIPHYNSLFKVSVAITV